MATQTLKARRQVVAIAAVFGVISAVARSGITTLWGRNLRRRRHAFRRVSSGCAGRRDTGADSTVDGVGKTTNPPSSSVSNAKRSMMASLEEVPAS